MWPHRNATSDIIISHQRVRIPYSSVFVSHCKLPKFSRCASCVFSPSPSSEARKKCQDRGLNTGPPDCRSSARFRMRHAFECVLLQLGFSLLLSQLSYPGHRENETPRRTSRSPNNPPMRKRRRLPLCLTAWNRHMSSWIYCLL